MNVLIVVGSHRRHSNSLKVAKYLETTLTSNFHDIDTDVLELADENVPLWNESLWQASSSDKLIWQAYAERVKQADSLILVAPEYAGMCPPILKNFLLLCSHEETAHKPVLLAGVSSGRGGHYPLAELRQFSFKNSHLCILPTNVLVTNANNVLSDSQPDSEDDVNLRNHINHQLHLFSEYSIALKRMREESTCDMAAFPYGV